MTAKAKCEKPIIESAIHPEINAILCALFVAPDTYINGKIFKSDYRLISEVAAKKILGKSPCAKNPRHALHEIQAGIKNIMDVRRISLELTDRIAECTPAKDSATGVLRFIGKIFGIPISNKLKSMSAPTHIAIVKSPNRVVRQSHMHNLSSIVYTVNKDVECIFVCQARWYRITGDTIVAIEDADIENYLLTNTGKEIIMVYRREGLLDNTLSNIMSLDGEISDPELLAKAIIFYNDNIRAKNVLFMADHNVKLMMLLVYYMRPNNVYAYTRLPFLAGVNIPTAKNPYDLQMLIRKTPIDAIVSIGWESIPFAGDTRALYRLVSAERDAFTYIRNTHGNIFWYDFSRKYTTKSHAWNRISLGTTRNFYVDKATLGGVILHDIDAYLQSYELSEQYYARRAVPLAQPTPSLSQLLMTLAPEVPKELPTRPPPPPPPSTMDYPSPLLSSPEEERRPQEIRVEFPDGIEDVEEEILGGTTKLI